MKSQVMLGGEEEGEEEEIKGSREMAPFIRRGPAIRLCSGVPAITVRVDATK